MANDTRIETTEYDVRTPVFTQTASVDYPELDQWTQVDETEAQVAYEMTLRNELSGGTPTVREFEQMWRQWCGSKYAITVCNGTLALYSAFFGLGVGPGDEVICPSYTWIGSISGALMLGANPVLCEIDPESLALDPEDVRQRITGKTKAIVAVHLWGNVCDLDALLTISQETGVPLVEDCSHAHGATYNGRHVGTLGRVGCWSLQGSKPVSAGEAGVIATDDIALFERACLLGQINRLGGVDLATERYQIHQPFGIGMKTRAHPLGIGIAKVQMEKLDALNARRGRFIEVVEAGLADLPEIQPVKVYDGVQRGGYYGFPLLLNPDAGNVSTETMIAALQAEGLPAKRGPYPPLHALPMFRDGFDLFTGNRCGLSNGYRGIQPGEFPVTEEVVERLIFLPVMSDPVPGADEQVIDAIHRAMERIGQQP
ncbi:DegT/DnrJ/EryC1/StrS family aminotransferase [Chloroflexi bacterium TSY]|nr:DegT/DnrJ/EryC1/StrS family aminotransferase [Chloroflexi bacterium TSY]